MHCATLILIDNSLSMCKSYNTLNIREVSFLVVKEIINFIQSQNVQEFVALVSEFFLI